MRSPSRVSEAGVAADRRVGALRPDRQLDGFDGDRVGALDVRDRTLVLGVVAGRVRRRVILLGVAGRVDVADAVIVRSGLALDAVLVDQDREKALGRRRDRRAGVVDVDRQLGRGFVAVRVLQRVVELLLDLRRSADLDVQQQEVGVVE